MAAGRYVVKIYDKRTRKTKWYLGPYKTKSQAQKSAEIHVATLGASKKHKHLGVSILD